MDKTKTRLLSKEQMIRELLDERATWTDDERFEGTMDDLMKIVDSRNTVVREGAQQGIPIVQMMRDDLSEAWEKYKIQLRKDGGIETIKNAAMMGRIRGLAQAVATVESPYTRLHSPAREWMENVKRVMNEARRR